MLLSDRELLAEIEAGTLALDPFDASLIQPSSIDVRLERFFRVCNNSRYTHIDPKVQQDDLTSLVEVEGDDAFVARGRVRARLDVRTRHPFRLAGRAAGGQVVAGPARAAHPLHRGLHRNVANLTITLWPGMKIGQPCLFR